MKILKEPAIHDPADRTVACISCKGNYIGNTAVFAELFGKLCVYGFQKQLMGPETVLIAAYYDDMNVTPPDELTLDICMTIPEDADGEGEVIKKILPGGTYAVKSVELDGPEEYPSFMGKDC